MSALNHTARGRRICATWLAFVTVLLLAFVAISLAGCGGSAIQRGLNTGATALVQVSAEAAPIYQERDATCRALHPPVIATSPLRAERRAQYDECMHPVETARTARAMTDRLLRAAQAAYDASGPDGFKAKVPCLLEAARQLLGALTELSDRVPEQLPDLVQFLAGYVTHGQECSHADR